MTGGINLTASMRSNLLSLQNISRQVSSTQNKLATGNNVNSAIDNPSSYYTARALNNRADDLNALLDSMGQAVSTIKAATTALEAGADFLEQAAAVVTQALETNTIPARSYFEEKVGANGAVVTTAQELKDAVAAGKETIVVYGKIDYFADEGIILKDGQKLIGTEYYTGYTGQQRFSQINFNGSQRTAIDIMNNAEISDLTIKFASTEGSDLIRIQGTGTRKLHNLNLWHDSASDNLSALHGAITAWSGEVLLSGHINIDGNGIYGNSVSLYHAKMTVMSDAELNIKANGSNACGLNIFYDSVLDSYGHINIESAVDGVVLGSDTNSGCILNTYAGSSINIKSKLLFKVGSQSSDGAKYNIINWETGSRLSGQADSGTVSVENKGTVYENKTSTYQQIAPDYFNDPLLFVIDPDFDGWGDQSPLSWTEDQKTAENISVYDRQYKNILTQYTALVKDASYKGINLLQSEQLNVKFNENGSADLNIKGKDMSATALGVNITDWQTQADIAESLSEISAALNSIRSYSAELGNNYNIITGRQDFTENLINILTEGADKLTLADMNEESANMLALQTRQQLAINSLSLASQASQAVLKLF